MLSSFNRNFKLSSIIEWIGTFHFQRMFSLYPTWKRKKKAMVQKTFIESARATKEESTNMQRSMFTGNFFAGPLALIHPMLLESGNMRKHQKQRG